MSFGGQMELRCKMEFDARFSCATCHGRRALHTYIVYIAWAFSPYAGSLVAFTDPRRRRRS